MEDDHLDVPANAENLKKIRDFVRGYIDKCKGLESYKDEIVLAIDEACQNVVRHAYRDKNGNVAIKLSFQNKEFIVSLEDDGTPAIPEKIKPRNIEDIKPGGLGTFFINQIMDSVSFQSTSPHWVNCLIMKKKIK
jgi:anti-sigma regulatory factor (Ser/Thr protein kinase)|tara:strand:+ start:290 stop:694 length:405 start_codon:yes stop_codon:yes gene_type:complete